MRRWRSWTGNRAGQDNRVRAINEFTMEDRVTVETLIRDSVAFAEAYYPDLSDYVTQHSQEMHESVMRQHIDLYVNQFSLSLGEEGRHAVDVLLEVYKRMHS